MKYKIAMGVLAALAMLSMPGAASASPAQLAQVSSAPKTAVGTLKIGFIGDSIAAGYNQYGHTIVPGVNDVTTFMLDDLAAITKTESADKGVPWNEYDQGSSGSSTRDWLPGSPNSLEGRAKAAFVSAFDTPDPRSNPVWVMIMLGTNDVRSDNLFTAQHHAANLKAIVQDLVSSGYDVVINFPPAFVAPTSFNGVIWSASALQLLKSYLPAEQSVVASFRKIAPGRVFMGDTSAFAFFASHPTLFQEYGVYGGLHPNGHGGTDALAGFWERAFLKVYLTSQKDI